MVYYFYICQKGARGMLQLVLGASGSGKSRFLLERVRERALAGQRSILLVPEQFTSTNESRLYRLLGDKLSGYVSSYSFSSLAEKVLSLYGGVAVKTMTDASRAVLVRRAVEGLGDEVVYYGRHKRSAAFCQLAAETIDELKNAGLSGQQFLQLAETAGAGGKLRELGLIFCAYEALLAGAAMDPGDRVMAAAERMEPDFLAGTAVFVDEFDTFNASKRRLLEAMLCASPSLTVALCADSLEDREGGMGLFSGAKQVAAALLRMARKNGAPCAAPILLRQDRRHEGAPGLARLNELLCTGGCEVGGAPEITLWQAQSREEEAAAVAAAIQRLARQGVPYNQMAVICRDSAEYLPPVRYAFRLAGIPLFCDEPTTAEHTAPALAVRAALGLLRGGITTEPLLRLVKTGLCALSEAQQCALENYAYTWQLTAADWRAPFARSPGGFGAEMDEEQREALALAESARAFLVPRVQRFAQRCKGADAAQLTRQLYFFLKELGAEDRTAALAAGLRQQAGAGLPAAEEAVREWNTVMEQLDQMALLVGGEAMPAAEYDDLFCLLLRTTDVGHIPQSLDSVIFTTAGRMRLDGPAYCFVMGLGEGEFPRAPGESGLLSHADRDALIRQGVEMPDCFENRVLREQVCFYKALTAPARGLWLSWAGGAAGLPVTGALALVQAALQPRPPELGQADYASTPAAALDALGQAWQQDGPAAAALYAALREQPDAAAALAAVRRAAGGLPYTAQDTAALEQVLGRSLRLSPSRVERYYSCRFAYFMQYVLRIRPRKKAELTPDQSGTLVHFVLEQAMKRTGEAFTSLSKEELAALAASLTDEYVAANMPEVTVRFAYLVQRLKKSITGLLGYLQAEQAQSGFKPEAFELEIGEESAVPPLVLQTPEGHTVRIVGKVDRVDALRREGKTWLRVVDYKTGDKQFSLEDVWCGLDCQMLLYLFTLAQNGGRRFSDPAAAGVLYLMADPPPENGTREEARQGVTYRLDGLVLDDAAVIAAMDRHATGLYVPFKFKKDGSAGASRKLASLEKLGRIRRHIDQLVIEMARSLYRGEIDAVPLCKGQRRPCDWCDYRCVCGHESGRGEKAVAAPDHVFERDEEEAQP